MFRPSPSCLATTLFLCATVCSCLGPGRGSRPARVDGVDEADSTEVEAGSPSPDVVQWTGVVALPRLLEHARRHHPELAAWRARVTAAEGERAQAGKMPNPVFSATVESAVFSGKTTGTAEFPVGVTQPIPLGSRLGAGERAAEAHRVRVEKELEESRTDIERRVRSAFVLLLFVDGLRAVEEEALETAKKAVKVASERVTAGDAPRVEKTRAELETAHVSLRLAGLRGQHIAALANLEEAVGVEIASGAEIEGELEHEISLPLLATLLERVGDSPRMLVQDATVTAAEAELLRAEAVAIPDLDVGVFYRRVEESDTNAVDLGIAIPVPIFDRGQGRTQAARARLDVARHERESERQSTMAGVRASYHRLRESLEVYRIVREEVLPRAHAIVKAQTSRYDAGDISLRELLLTRREHREHEIERLQSLRDISVEWARLRALLGLAD